VINTDIALIEYARRCGETVTVRQLKRWRSNELLPARTVRGRGRGRGVTGFDAPWTRFQGVAVSRALSFERNTDRAALRLWYQGWDIPTERIVKQIDQRLERDRQHLPELQHMVGTGTGTGKDMFDVAEADSRARPITHEEIARMRPAARGADESARDLVHAARTAIEGQIFSPAGEVSAIPEEIVKQYLNFNRDEEWSGSMGDLFNTAFDQTTSLMQDLTAADVLRTPTASQLVMARCKLRHLYDAIEIVHMHRPEPHEAQLFAQGVGMLAHIDTSFDPRSRSYNAEKLLLGLRTVAQVSHTR